MEIMTHSILDGRATLLECDVFAGLASIPEERRATLIELNSDYVRLARARIESAFMSTEAGASHMALEMGRGVEPESLPLFASK